MILEAETSRVVLTVLAYILRATADTETHMENIARIQKSEVRHHNSHRRRPVGHTMCR